MLLKKQRVEEISLKEADFRKFECICKHYTGDCLMILRFAEAGESILEVQYVYVFGCCNAYFLPKRVAELQSEVIQ